MLRERDKTILKLTPVEKPWGPDYLRFGMNLSSDFRTESPYNLRALYRKTWINAYGGGVARRRCSWAATRRSPRSSTSRSTTASAFFVRPFASVSPRRLGLYFDGDRLAEYRLRDTRAGFDLGVNLDVYGQASVGWLERTCAPRSIPGRRSCPDSTLRFGGATAKLALDTQDFAFFPTRGYRWT